jgi:hypothetical protein
MVSEFDICAGCSSLALCAPTRHEAALARSSDGPSADQGRCRCTCQQDRTHGLGHDGARRTVQGAEVAAGGIGVSSRQKVIGNWQGHNDVMQTRSFRGSGEPAWVIASSNACFRVGPDPRRALGPAAIRAALTGRTHGCTDQPANVKKSLANSEPSTHGTKCRHHCVAAIWSLSGIQRTCCMPRADSRLVEPHNRACPLRPAAHR